MAKAPTTTTYTWPNDSLVRRIDVREQSDGRAVAYLYADESETARPQRQALRTALRQKGWGTLSDYRDGAYALRISGISSKDELLNLLRDSQAITSEAKESQSNAEKSSNGLIDTLKQNSLRASGLFYTAGNFIYLTSGILRQKEEAARTGNSGGQSGQIGSALMWGSGDLLIAAMGGNDEARQYQSLLGKLHAHYQKEGFEVPKNASLHVETAPKTLGSKAYNLVADHLNQIKCATEAVASIFYFKAGQQQGNFWKQVTAVIFGTGFTASMLIPERKIDPEKYEQASTFGKLWMKVQSQPLSVGGLSGYSNTILTSYSAFDEGRRFNNPEKYPTLPNKNGEIIPPSKYYKLDYAAPGVMFFGNSLYAMSKKSGGDIKTDAMVNDVYIVAAQILNKQPESLREAAIESTAKFLGERPEIKDTHAEVVTKLREQMSVQRESPWFEKTPLPAYTPQPKKPKIAIGREALALAGEASSAQPAATVDTQGLQHAGTAVQKAAAVTQAAAL